ncbi:MAG TPA: hypothetical protein ENG16_04945 [Archaeoglobus sp.]|nr:hypothetical protein [Archaeoglobus sp.]
MLGGFGYTTKYVAEKCFRDARAETIYEGRSEISEINCI